MSNPESYGPYWQDQDDASYGSGRRRGPNPTSRQESAWDDGNGFWRDDSSQSNAGRDRGPSRHQAAPNRGRQSPSRGSRGGAAAGAGDAPWPQRSRREPQSADDWGSRRDAGRSAGRGRRAADDDRTDWTGRLSQTAGDLRSKLGNMRTRAAASLGGDRQAAWGGAAEDDFGRRTAAAGGMGGNGALNGGRGAGRAGSSARASQSRGEAGPGRGARRAAHAGGYGTGRYEVGGYGPGDYGPGDYDSRTAGGRTALRDPAGDLWDQPDRTSRGVRSRVAERQYSHGGGNGRGGGGHGGRSNGGGPHGRGGGFTNWLLYGSWWRHWTLKKALAVVGVGIAACFLLGIAGFFILYEMTPIPTAAEQTANWQSSTVYLANGRQMGVFDGGGIERMLLTSQQIPKVMTEAMAAAEDRHFYSEGGVSLTGLLRSAYDDLRGNGNLQGGSTITMQYAKNYYSGVDTGQNLSTKLKEIFIAMKLGRKESKSWVMTNYLNTVPFGSTVDGLGAAAESFFNVNLTQHPTLSLAQAALLASLPNNPAVFSSALAGSNSVGLTELHQRFTYVLTNMVRDGDITQAQANATKFPKLTPPPSGNGETGYTGYLMQMVLQQLEAPKADGGYGLTLHKIDTQGYKITTTFNMAKVKALAKAVSAEKNQMKLAAEQQPGRVSFRNYDRMGAVLENSKTGAIIAIYGGPGYSLSPKRCKIYSCMLNMAEEAEPVGSSFKPYVLSEAVKLGMNVMTSKLNGFSPIWIPLSSSVTSSAVTQAALSPTRPPAGCPAAPASGGAGNCLSNGTEYFLFNEPGENYHKPLAVNEAAAVSSDPAFEDLAHRDGVDNVIDMARELGVGQTAFVDPCPASNGSSYANTLESCNDMTGPVNGLIPNFSTTHFTQRARINGTPGSPAIALGENPLTPIEQASTFATLADDGVYHTPHVIQSLQRNGTTVPSNVKTRTVLSPAQAADVDYALSFDNTWNQPGEQGTAVGTVPFAPGDLIAKTGTLGEQAVASEAWFNGSTRKLDSLSVALFTNLPHVQNLDNLPNDNGTPGSQGGGWPASVFNAYMQSNVQSSQILPLLPTVTTNFQTWIRVKAQAPKKKICKQGGGGPFGGHGGGNQNCVCAPGAVFCGHNPNPQPSCHGNGNGNGNCTSGGPSPSPSCQVGVLGSQCNSPSPSVSPSVSPSTSCSTGTPPGQCGTTNLTAYVRRISPGSGSSPGSAASGVVLAAEDAATRLTALLGLLI